MIPMPEPILAPSRWIAMNLDDESVLSAYLDDELDAARRRQVAACLQSDPRLVQRLRDLALIRDLVAGLGSPKASAVIAGLLSANGVSEGAAASQVTVTTPTSGGNAVNYRQMIVWTSAPLRAFTLLSKPGGDPYHVNAALVSPYVVNVFSRTIYTR